MDGVVKVNWDDILKLKLVNRNLTIKNIELMQKDAEFTRKFMTEKGKQSKDLHDIVAGYETVDEIRSLLSKLDTEVTVLEEILEGLAKVGQA